MIGRINRIVVVGGGISGLAAAHRLTELSNEHQVTLLEASGRLGGTIQTEHRDGFLLERGPDSFISEKPQASQLAKRLGLESQLIQTNEKYRRSFIVQKWTLACGAGRVSVARAIAYVAVSDERYLQSGGQDTHGRGSVFAAKEHEWTNDESLASFVRRLWDKKHSNAWPNRWSAVFTPPIRKR